MKKFFISLFAILIIIPSKIFCIQLSDAEKDWIAHISPLKFSEVEWEPLSFTYDFPVYRGIIADYLQILSESTGIHFDYIKSETWQEVLNRFSKGEIDLIPAVDLKDRIDSEIIFTDPYISFPLVIATGPNIDFISYTHELKGKLVGVGKGYTSQNFLKNNYPEIQLVTTDNVKEGLKLLDRGEIDAFVGHMAVVMDAIKKNRFDLRIAGKTEYIFEHRMGLPPGHKRTALIFNRVFSHITPEEHNRIYNKWIKMNTEITDYSLVWKILISAVIIITGIFFWNRKLSSDKKRFQHLYSDLNALKDELESKNTELNKLAITDRLTGLYNRLKLDEALKKEFARYSRSSSSFGIILIDIDHFKMINDTYGHPTGDIILVSISQLLLSSIRITDIPGRWGGEEFLIICPGTDIKGIEKIAEKLRSIIEAHNFPEIKRCTASFGATICRNDDTIAKIIKRTDEALYEAKKSGRNRVMAK